MFLLAPVLLKTSFNKYYRQVYNKIQTIYLSTTLLTVPDIVIAQAEISPGLPETVPFVVANLVFPLDITAYILVVIHAITVVTCTVEIGYYFFKLITRKVPEDNLVIENYSVIKKELENHVELINESLVNCQNDSVNIAEFFLWCISKFCLYMLGFF